MVEHIKIHGTALEGNLEGDAVDRDVFVFLPPSYEKDKRRRYPVLYALHGYSIGAEQWTDEIHGPHNYGIANSFEIYSGTHTSAVADRFQNHGLPFFSKSLCFEAGCKLDGAGETQ
jgi:hypothetical protein